MSGSALKHRRHFRWQRSSRRRPTDAAPRAARITTYLGDGATAAAPAPGAVAAPAFPSIAGVLTRHVLRDGELVILILKPSRWLVVLSTLKFVLAAAMLLAALQLAHAPHYHVYVESTLFVLGGFWTWAVLQWMSRLYVLTDQRVLRLSGVLTVDVFDCPLRKVARTRIVRTARERCLGLGSIEILPMDDQRPCGTWNTIARPTEVNEQVNAAIRRAKQGGWGGR